VLLVTIATASNWHSSGGRWRPFRIALGVVGATRALLAIDCAGRFACLGALFSLAMLCVHVSEWKRSAAPLVGMCASLLLLLACAVSLRTWLAMLFDRYEFGFFRIDYRQFG